MQLIVFSQNWEKILFHAEPKHQNVQSVENISSNIHRMKSFGKKSLELHHLKSFTPRLSRVDLKKAKKNRNKIRRFLATRKRVSFKTQLGAVMAVFCDSAKVDVKTKIYIFINHILDKAHPLPPARHLPTVPFRRTHKFSVISYTRIWQTATQFFFPLSLRNYD